MEARRKRIFSEPDFFGVGKYLRRSVDEIKRERDRRKQSGQWIAKKIFDTREIRAIASVPLFLTKPKSSGRADMMSSSLAPH
jgi:hypothetical protein